MRKSEWIKSIVGTESELSVWVARGAMVLDSAAQWLVQSLIASGILPGVNSHGTKRWLQSGGVVYLDVGNHPEYCTPECAGDVRISLSAHKQAAIYEWAGPFLFQRVFEAVDKSVLPPGLEMWLFKNNTDKLALHSWANHLNILMPAPRAADGRVQAFLETLNDFAKHAAAMVATMPLLVGAGVVFPKSKQCPTPLGAENYAYRISARSSFVTDVVSASSTRNRPFFLNRSEHHAGSKPYYRLQVLALDANIIPSVIELKLGMLSLMVKMWAAGELMPLVLANPVLAYQLISTCWYRPVALESGGCQTAAEIQKFYLEQAKEFVRRHELTEFESVLEAWEYQVELFLGSQEVPRELYGLNDWVTKWMVLQDQTSKRNKLTYEQAEEISHKYHGFQLGDKFESSFPVKLARRHGGPEFMAAVQRACDEPPQTTRAIVRKQFLELVEAQVAAGVEPSFEIDWARLKYGYVGLDVSNPWSVDSQRLGRIRAQCEKELGEAA